MNVSSMEIFEDEKFAQHHVKFLLLLVLQIPSIAVSLFIFAYFIRHRTLLQACQNQALLIVLVVNFVQVSFDLPMSINFYRLGRVSPATAAYCTWWTFFEYSLDVTSELLMATISIQRHMLVFQGHVLRVRLKRFLLHHLPLLFCLVYPIVFYMIIIVFYPCDGTQWDFTLNLCGCANCYLLYNKVLGTFDWAVNNGLPMVIIILANAALVIRVVWQKHRRQRFISWRRQRRMTLQLLSISCLYLIAWLPALIIGVGQQLNSPSFLAQIQSDYLLDLIYLVCLFVPWVCLGLVPDLGKWIWKRPRLRLTARTAVGPTRLVGAITR